MSTTTSTPSQPGPATPTDPTTVDPDTGTAPGGEPVENPSG